MPSENSVFLHAFLLNGEGRAERLSWQDGRAQSVAAGVTWLHLDAEDEASQVWLREDSGLDEVACEALLADATRPRSASIGAGLLVILRGVNLNPGADPEDMVSVRLWVDAKRMISLSRRRLMAVQDLALQLEGGEGPGTSGELLTLLAGRLLERIAPLLHRLDETIDAQEEQALSADPRILQAELAEQRRQLIALRRHLAPQKDAMMELARISDAVLGKEVCERVQFLADQVARYVEDLSELKERTQVSHDLITSRVAEAMNRQMLVLSVITAVFLPLSLLTGLLGINVAGIPGASNEWAFLAVCAVIALLAGLQLWMMRRRRWF